MKAQFPGVSGSGGEERLMAIEKKSLASQLIGAAIFGVILVVTLSMCSGYKDNPTTQASRCESASAVQLEYINAGVKGVASYNFVRSGSTVKSEDYANAYFVAAKVYGPGIEDGTGPGVWFITGDKDSPGLVFSVNSYARVQRFRPRRQN
jgi:hypothetical protein